VQGDQVVLAGVEKREKALEVAFIVAFSALIFAFFFSLLGVNGVILGNDPAIHLQTAQYYLNSGRIPLSDAAWYTPLYHLVLDTFIAFTGAKSIEQTLFLMKAVTALVDWLLFFSVYIVAARFFGRKTGVFAVSLLLLCFPLFELNSWGGYTSIMSMVFMTLLMYLALPIKSSGNTAVAFILAFSLVLSHQLATFLAIFILPPFIIVVLVKSKGHFSKALFAAVLGGVIAFLIYYVKPILPFLGEVISIVFFQLKAMLYQVPFVSFDSFMVNFGFVFFFALAGLVIAFFELRKRKSLSFYLLLALAFLVPLFFSQSYLVGMYLPYQRFVYFLVPPLAILAAVSMSFVIDVVLAAYFNNRAAWKRNFLKGVSGAIVFVLVAVMVLQFQNVTGRIREDITFYSTSDVNAYQVGTWVNQNFPDPSVVGVATQKPGHWFSVYSGKTVIAQTSPVIEWNVNAECILALSYEMAHPLTMVRVYGAKSNISQESYISVNMAWQKVAYFTENTTSLSFRDQNDTLHVYSLSSLNRTIAQDEVHYPKSISVKYSGEEFMLKENILFSNDNYPMTISWQLSALQDLNNAVLTLNYYVEPSFSFDNAYIPGVLNWENPWNNPSSTRDGWAVTEFSATNLTLDNHVSVYDEKNQAAFSLKFDDLPDSGSIGVLSDRNIDALRFNYKFYKVDTNSTVSRTYQLLTFSQSNQPQLENLTKMNTLFDYKNTEPFDVQSRNFASIIRENHIGFIVYDVQSFDPSILSSKWLDLIYSNDKYVVLKIKADHPYADILENTIN
jgi:hypothetical protein